MNWKDPARIAQLTKLWADGLSAGQIAAKIGGVSRNAVIGAVYRLRLPMRHTTNRLTPNPRRKAQPSQRKPSLSPAAQVLKDIRRDGLPLPTPAETDIPRIATADLESNHCRFPCVADITEVASGAPIFCGLDKVPGSSYCAAHLARAVNVSKPLRPVRVPPERVMQVA
jgi:GcrA cell cycle regulator